ncbi:hypothetical protein GcM3_026035 [Golovinomyces cichoracearum]|uniref:CCHC-type domain-containing protein n=1 Tax=Golovinomyces cichoracearum TaxID=62708 RepID=A0A420J6B7_9PEZI|nr:hypothetical protein GcM3_026035 [Golovinomyces cichoracearum]
MDKLEAVVNSSTITPTESFSKSQIKEIKETKGKEKAEPSKTDFNLDNDNKRGPLSIPGLQSTWNPARGPFRAPKRSPGPRNERNLLCLLDPNLDREDRKTWPLHNSNSEYIQWLWKYWCELVAESDLDKSTLDVRNSNKPFRPGLKPLLRTSDVENLLHLQEIQSALMQEGTYYHLWPQRVCHLFQGDLKQVNSFCRTHRPTWPMTVEAILQILSLSNMLRSPVDAFISIRTGPLQKESTAEFLRRFEQAFLRIPTRERCDREVEYTIEYTLQTHAGMVWNTLVQQNDAFPLHNALSIAWTIAEKYQNWMAQLSSRPLDREPLPVFQDPLRAENDTSHFSPSPIFNDPIASVNAATAQTVCYNCGKLGHFSTDCRSIRKAENFNQQSPGNKVFGTFRARIQKAPPPLPRRSNHSISAYANKSVNFEDEDYELWESDEFQDWDPITTKSNELNKSTVTSNYNGNENPE